MKYLTTNTPIGKLTIAEDNGYITHIFLNGEEPINNHSSETTPLLKKAETQLGEYFKGQRTIFDLPIKPNGGPFFQKVWQTMIDKVPFGTTTSYSQIAELVNSPKACRAIGMANNRNPIPIIIPCHRIVGKNGNLTGFRGGLDMKTKLLKLEEQA